MIHQPRLRLYLACALVSAWMFLLLVGLTVGGAVHGLLLAGLVLWPWRRAGDLPASGTTGSIQPPTA